MRFRHFIFGRTRFKRFVSLLKIPKIFKNLQKNFQNDKKLKILPKKSLTWNLKRWVGKWSNFVSSTIMALSEIFRNSTILVFSKMMIPHEHPFKLIVYHRNDDFERNWDIFDGDSLKWNHIRKLLKALFKSLWSQNIEVSWNIMVGNIEFLIQKCAILTVKSAHCAGNIEFLNKNVLFWP